MISRSFIKIRDESLRRETSLVIFWRRGSVAYIIPNFTNFFTKRNAKSQTLIVHFAKKFKLLVNMISSVFFAKRGKSVEKMVQRKKNRGHQTSKIVIN